MGLPPASHCHLSRVSVPQDSCVGFPTGPQQPASALPCSTGYLLDEPQCVPVGSLASSEGWVPTPRLIILMYIKFFVVVDLAIFPRMSRCAVPLCRKPFSALRGIFLSNRVGGHTLASPNPLIADGFPIVGAHQ